MSGPHQGWMSLNSKNLTQMLVCLELTLLLTVAHPFLLDLGERHQQAQAEERTIWDSARAGPMRLAWGWLCLQDRAPEGAQLEPLVVSVN